MLVSGRVPFHCNRDHCKRIQSSSKPSFLVGSYISYSFSRVYLHMSSDVKPWWDSMSHPGCLMMGSLLMVYCNPPISLGSIYNPLYTLNNQGFFLALLISFFNRTETGNRKTWGVTSRERSHIPSRLAPFESMIFLFLPRICDRSLEGMLGEGLTLKLKVPRWNGFKYVISHK